MSWCLRWSSQSRRLELKYLSSSSSDANAPGAASRPRSPPAPSSNSIEPVSSPARTRRARKWITSLANGCWSRRSRQAAMRLAVRRANGSHDFFGNAVDIPLLRQLHETGLEPRSVELGAHLLHRAGRHHRALFQQHEMGAQEIDLLEDWRRKKDRSLIRRQARDDAAQDHCAGNIQAGEWLVEHQQLGIVEERGNQHDALAHSFGIRVDGKIAALVQI